VAQAPQVAVVGLSALNRDIKRATDNAGPIYAVMSQAGKQAAAPIAAQARSSYPTGATGRLAASVRFSGTRSGASVRVGSASVPYAGPVDFGGWPEGRQYLTNGRYLFPAAVGLASEAAQLYEAALNQGFADFPWTNETTSAGAVHD
jgi:hypothetical protein